VFFYPANFRELFVQCLCASEPEQVKIANYSELFGSMSKGPYLKQKQKSNVKLKSRKIYSTGVEE
jgi:hypothetical protein